jgi:hypothetical protein
MKKEETLERQLLVNSDSFIVHMKIINLEKMSCL